MFQDGVYANGRCDSSPAFNFVIVIVLCKGSDYSFAWCCVRAIVYHLWISLNISNFFLFLDTVAGEWIFCLELADINKE